MTNRFEKFLLVLWKDWVMQWNHKPNMCVELFLPSIFVALLVWVRTLVVPTQVGDTVYNNTYTLENLNYTRYAIRLRQEMDMSRLLQRSRIKNPLRYHLAYSPNTSPVFDAIVKAVATKLDLTYSGHKDSKSLDAVLNSDNIFAGIEFRDSQAFITDYPKHLVYALRFPSELRTPLGDFIYSWMTNLLFYPINKVGPRNRYLDNGGHVGYIPEGFLAVQHAIAVSFIRQSAKQPLPSLPDVYTRRFPYAAYVDDSLIAAMGIMMVPIILLSYIYQATYTVKCVTAEKEKQLKELMKIMGLDNWIHWSAWFARSFLMMGCSAFFITVLLTYKWNNDVAVLTFSSFTAVYFYLLTYSANSIFLCFMLATFFKKANTAAAVTALIWIIIYLPYIFIHRNYQEISLGTKMGWAILSNTAMGLAVGIISQRELQGVGLQWSNMFERASIDDELSLGHIYIMMIISSFLYMLVALYMEQVFPGDYGVAREWNFPFRRSYWNPSSHGLGVKSTESMHRDKFASYGNRDKVGIEIRRLNKSFGDKVVVNNLNLSMYENETTVLLGHNGAGKTTTIMIVIGMIPPKSGTVILNGYDIRTDMESARMSLGICPQHNVIFDDLTVRNHLVFFGRLKGFTGPQLEEEVELYLKKIGLTDKADLVSSKLSGGMKRKLSVCTAFCGGSKVVICDEPSSGMDPAARRHLWDFIQSEKRGRTILLTTHFMDEAEVLGDQIAIMRAGKIQCSGSLFYLKKRYGDGYKLICEKKEGCDSTKVTQLLEKYIPNIEPNFEVGLELSYILPEEYVGQFERILKELEDNSDELKLNGYGISLTSLEEVFLKVGAERIDEKPEEGEGEVPSVASSLLRLETAHMASAEMFSEQNQMKSGYSLWLSQWQSMLFKKYTCAVTSKIPLVLQNIMPVSFVIITILSVTLTVFTYLKPRLLTLLQYPNTVTVYEITDNVGPGTTEFNIGENYKELVRSYPPQHLLKGTGSEDFVSYILRLGREIQPLIDTRYIVGATFDKGRITAWFNNEPFHSAPVSVNMIDIAIAKLVSSDISISVTNKPLPYTAGKTLQDVDHFENVGFQIVMNLSFCMSFVTATYSMFMIIESELRAKLLQFVAGVRAMTFWFSHFLCDLVTFTMTVITLNVTLYIFHEDGYSTVTELSRYTFLFYIFGFAALPYVYLLSKWFNEPVIGFTRLVVLFFFTGNAFFFVIMVMSGKMLKIQSTADKLKSYFMLFPHFSMTYGLMDIYRNNRIHTVCEPLMDIEDEIRCKQAPDCCKLYPFFGRDQPGVLIPIIYLICSTIVFFIVILLIEYKIINALVEFLMSLVSKPQSSQQTSSDDDVERVKDEIRNMTNDQISTKNLVVDRLVRYYGSFLAVNEVSFFVERSQCFGLLGVNGAGKTSTFKMLTGDLTITSGDAYVQGLSVRKELYLVYRKIGYCPQFDALFNNFTGRDMLKMFCLLRGIPPNNIQRLSEQLAKIFGFTKHIDKRVQNYSGGNKRKLSAAIAIVGNPEVVYLDEPTTGMDPAARRLFWNVICGIRDSGKSIVLTTHSMEECEALSTCLAIMVNGELKCIGSTQHLKNKFSQGLIVKVKLRDNIGSLEDLTTSQRSLFDVDEGNVRALTTFLKKKFPGTQLRDQHRNLLTYYLPTAGVKWSGVFGVLEQSKDQLNIEDYTISQTTLEEIFLQLVMYSRDHRSNEEILRKALCPVSFPLRNLINSKTSISTVVALYGRGVRSRFLSNG